MNETEEAKIVATVVAFGSILVAASAFNYVKIVRVERKKRKKIEEWKLENIACIRSTHAELMAKLEDPSYNLDNFWTDWHETQKFLRIVQNQPKY